MPKLEKLLETEMTRKQFITAIVSALIGMTGLSAFLGAFSKNVQPAQSSNPGYGERGYGP